MKEINQTNSTCLFQRSFIGLLLIALVIGSVLGFLSLWFRYFIFTDGAVYATVGGNIAEGKGLTYCGATHLFYPPGYPIAIALFYRLVQNAELAGHLVSYVAYLGSIVLTACLAWHLRRSMLFAALSTVIVVLHPQFILHASYVLSESLFVCVILAASLCCWKLANGEHSPYWLWGLWGALLGYAYLIRADGIVYFPLQAIFILINQRTRLKAALVKGSVALVLLLLVMAPYLLLIKQQKGEWMLSTKTSIILEYARGAMKGSSIKAETSHTSNVSDDGVHFEIDKADETLGGFLLHHPDEAFQRMMYWSGYLLRQSGMTFGWIDIIFFVIVCFALGRRIFSNKSLFIILHLIPIVLFLLLFIDKRFLLAFIPFLGFGIARGLEQFWIWGVEGWNNKKARILLLSLIGIMIVIGFYVGRDIPKRVLHKFKTVFNEQSLPLEHKQMGLWMKENLNISPTTRISHRNPWVSFYVEGCHQRTAIFESVDKLVKWLRHPDINASYLIVDERMTKPTMPNYTPLLNENKAHVGLRHIHTIEGRYPKIVLYKIIDKD